MDAERYCARPRSMQRSLRAVVSLSIVAAAACKEGAWTPMGNAEFVLSEIKAGGSAQASKRIDSDENFGRSVTNGIATGDSLWLEVADKLTPASAAAQATLSMALATALPHSPERVLSLVGQKYPVEEVCGIPFLKADSALVTTYHDEAISALARINAARLISRRDACRATLDQARTRRLERISPSYVVKNNPVPPPRRPRKKAVTPAQPVTPKDSSSSD